MPAPAGHAEPRLRPGCHLFRRADGGWRLYGPEDRFARITGPEAALAEAAAILGGQRPVSEAGFDAAELLAALADRGALAPAPKPQHPAPGPAGRRVQVLIADAVGEVVAGLLSPHAEVTCGRPGDPLLESDVLVWCSAQLPDEAWQGADAACAAAGRPWHRTYAEGGRYIAGPFSVPGRTAGYLDARARRLAAAAAPDDLRELWAALDREPGPPTPPSQAAAAIVGGVVAADVLGFLADGTVASAGDQLVVDPALASVAHHPVLPLPAGVGAVNR